MIEIWKDIKGYEGLYRVSNSGEIYSIRKNNKKILKMKHWLDKDGYHTVKLCKNKKQKQYRVHRLVAEMFVENTNNLPQVNHLDGNKDNNNVLNLEWITLRNNIIHGYKIGLYRTGSKRCNSKLEEHEIKWIRENYIKGSREYGSRPLARKFNVTKTCIYYIVNNVTYREI